MLLFKLNLPPLHYEKIMVHPQRFLASLFLTMLLCASHFPNTAYSQERPVPVFSEAQYTKQLSLLTQKFGQKKDLPLGYELQTLIALSYFPELTDIKIEFIVDDVKIPLSSRPYWASMLRSAKNRTYLVIIDNQLEGARDALLLKNQPFNAQIGIIGHELSHTAYYIERSFLGIVKDALCQLSQCRVNFERATDRRLIEHGLGWQRLSHAEFVRARLSGPQYMKNPTAEGGAYMSPSELLQVMESSRLYQELGETP